MWIKNIQSSASQDEIRQLINGGANVMVDSRYSNIVVKEESTDPLCRALAPQTANIPSKLASLHVAGHLRKT